MSLKQKYILTSEKTEGGFNTIYTHLLHKVKQQKVSCLLRQIFSVLTFYYIKQDFECRTHFAVVFPECGIGIICTPLQKDGVVYIFWAGLGTLELVNFLSEKTKYNPPQ